MDLGPKNTLLGKGQKIGTVRKKWLERNKN